MNNNNNNLTYNTYNTCCEKKCIFICIFYNKKYLDLFYLLLESIILYGKLDENTNILVYTNTEFMIEIKKNKYFTNKIIFELNDSISQHKIIINPTDSYNLLFVEKCNRNNYNNSHEAAISRLDIFSLHSLSNFHKILYLDTDIIIRGDINTIFSLCKKDLLYTLEEGSLEQSSIINHDPWGRGLFSDSEISQYKDTTAFSSGILLFNNSEPIKKLFHEINMDIKKRQHYFYDQPHIVYNAFKYNMFDNKILKNYAINDNEDIRNNYIINHFPSFGQTIKKTHKMTKFMNSLKHLYSIQKEKLLWVGDDYRSKSGYGRVARELFPFLKNNYDIYNYAIAYQGPSSEYNIIDSNDGTSFGFNKLPHVINEIKPDIIVLLNDSSIITGWLHFFQNLTYKPKIIPYLCTEYIGITEHDIQLYNSFTSGILTMATFTINELVEMGYKHKTYRLPHGYSETIQKMDKKEAKKRLGIDPNAFVFFSGNKNQPRKRLDIIIRAYVLFLHENKNENVLLMMNCGLIDSGWNLKQLYNLLCRRYNIENKDKYIYFCSENISDANKSDDELTIIYNACDVGITTSTGESFGLISFEQSALGIPQIVPDWGGITESIQYGSIKIKPHDFYVYPVSIQSSCGEAIVVSFLDVKKAMDMYYKDKELYTLHSSIVWKNTENQQWKKIAEQYYCFIKNI